MILADEELREVAPERSTGIEIQEFVNEAEISSLYFEKPYYLEPDKGAGKAFALGLLHDEVQKLIEAKAKGQKREAPAPKAAKGNVIDLGAALQESLGSVKKGKKRSAA